MSADDPARAPALNLDQPWPGLAAYEESASEYFSGRADEAAELVRRIRDEAVTVLYGKSGLGKSSLLRAGVFPALRGRGLLPVVVRLQFGDDALALAEQLAQRLFEELAEERVAHPPRRADESLWEYLHRDGLTLQATSGRGVKPVFVLDQFEEVFTLGRRAPDAVRAFAEQLADLAENRLPAVLAARLDAAADAEQNDEEDGASALDLHAQPYKFVVSLREDFLADLEGWAPAMPSLRRNRMRLLPMGRRQALQAIHNACTRHLVDAAAAEQIVAILGFLREKGVDPDSVVIEPALLSLFCAGINERRREQRLARFTPELIAKGERTIIADFYDRSLADQSDALKAFVEEQLVTDQGYRNSYAIAQAIDAKLATQEQIDALVQRRLLRKEHHLGAERVELTHDLLTEPALEGRKRRARARWEAQTRAARMRWGAVVVALLTAVVVFGWQWRQALAAKSDAEKERDRAEASEKGLRESRDSLRATLHELDIAQHNRLLALQQAQASASAAERAASAAELERLRAVDAGKTADAASRVARSRELAARALAETAGNRDVALLLALESLRASDTPEARGALLEAARFAWPTSILSNAQLGGRPNRVAIDGSGRYVAVVAEGSGRTTVSAWDVRAQPPEQRWRREWPDRDQRALAFSADGGLLVARPGGIDRVDTTHWQVASLGAMPNNESIVQIATSGDGRWLIAVNGKGALLVSDQTVPAAGWETVVAKGVGAFGVGGDGTEIYTVTSSPLAASVYERSASGAWLPRPLPKLTECVKVQSVSSAASHFVATWKAQACTISPSSKESPDRVVGSAREPAIADTVFSANGNAFLAVLASNDLRVGLGQPTLPRAMNLIKGTGIQDGDFNDNKVNDLGVNNSGTRVVVRAGDEVRVVSLAGSKLLLADHPRNAVDAADGRHIVYARRNSRGATLSMTPIESIGQGPGLQREWRVDLPDLPLRLTAGSEAVLAVIRDNEARRTAAWLYSMQSGAALAGPLDGAAQFVGPHQRWVWTRRGANEFELLRSADGRSARSWGAPGGGSRATVRTVFSPDRELVAVGVPTNADGQVFDVEVISLRGDVPRTIGRVTGLEARSWTLSGVNNAGTRLYGTRATGVASTPGRSVGGRVNVEWPLSSGRDTAGAREAVEIASATKPSAADDVTRSASGRLALVTSGRAGSAGASTALIRTDTPEPIYSFGARAIESPSFSPDERRLAFVESGGVEVVDLISRRTLFVWRDLGAQNVSFNGDGSLLKIEMEGGYTLLAPLELALLQRFAQWLVPRSLSDEEKCTHGLAGAGCRSVPSAAGRPASAPRHRATARSQK